MNSKKCKILRGVAGIRRFKESGREVIYDLIHETRWPLAAKPGTLKATGPRRIYRDLKKSIRRNSSH